MGLEQIVVIAVFGASLADDSSVRGIWLTASWRIEAEPHGASVVSYCSDLKRDVY